MPVSHQLAGLNEALERTIDQFLAVLEVIENLLAEGEEAAIDSLIAIGDVTDIRDKSAAIDIDQMKSSVGFNTEERSYLVLGLKFSSISGGADRRDRRYSSRGTFLRRRGTF